MSYFNKRVVFSIYFFNALLSFCNCLDPISAVTALGGAVISLSLASYYFINCKYSECCDDQWIKFNYDGLKNQLQNNLYGQNLASEIVLKTLKGFLAAENPKKPLVMSFHGTTGVGKNFVAQMIADNLYKNSTHSKYIHFYLANTHFPHDNKISEYKESLRKDIVAYTKLCGRSLFIFDEVHQMPPGILDAIKPFLDYHNSIDGVDFRKNIFIFLSNGGGDALKLVALEAWHDGKDREAITMKDIEPLISKRILNERGGFYQSQILQNELIDIYVPFFPLEKKHVKMCITAALKEQRVKYDEEIVNNIANELVYFPKEVDIFSASGCKRIGNKVLEYV